MTFDIAIVGAGIAGASLAAMIGPRAKTVLIEGESHAGLHATGRSAAFWSETYGGPGVQPLTSASGPFLADPPEGYGPSYLSPRGELEIATEAELPTLDARLSEFAGSGVVLERLDAEALHRIAPELGPQWVAANLLRSCQDIDVARLHQDFLKSARGSGAKLVTDARIVEATRDDGIWRLETARGETLLAQWLVNAAGAWADEIALMAGIRPIGIQPMRRTMVQIATDKTLAADRPLIIAADGSFYFKPESGGPIWLSPHDEIPSLPCDAQPEELDIAIAIDRLQKASSLNVEKVERSWAGLRSFAPDRLPVIGADRECEGFFWFAGQGGFGIQTAPATAMLGAAMLTGTTLPSAVAHIDPATYAPDRFS